MMIPSASESFDSLREATIALTVAIVIVLAARPVLRRYCGPGVAYAIWWLLPTSLLVLALPAPSIEISPQWYTMPRVATTTATTTMPAAVDFIWLWICLWALGAVIATVYQWRLQQRFLKSLGRLHSDGLGVWRAQASEGLPALIGAFRPRIVLPVDFESRYDASERELMLAHEYAHLRRGDPIANLVAATLRIVFWFHPLVHLAVPLFRADQELACDERVIANAPHARRTYGEAMLKTIVATQPLPLGCHWRHAYHLKERIMQLNTSSPRRAIRAIGVVVTCALIAGTAFAVWSAQAPVYVSTQSSSTDTGFTSQTAHNDVQRGDIQADITTRIDDGEPATFAINAVYDKPIVFYHQDGNDRFDVEARIRDAGQGRYDIVATVERGGRIVAKPRLITEAGKAATVRIGEETVGKHFKGIEFEIVLRPIESRDLTTAQQAELAAGQRTQAAEEQADASMKQIEAEVQMTNEQAEAAEEQAQAIEDQVEAARQQAQAAKEQAEAAEEQAEAARQQAQATEEQAEAMRERAQAAKEQAEAAEEQAETIKEENEAAAKEAEAKARAAAMTDDRH